MRRRAIAFVAALSLAAPAGCSGVGAYALRRPVSPSGAASAGPLRVSDEECARWLAARRTWNALSLGFGSAAGGGGALTAAVDAGDGGRIAIGVSTLVLGAAAVLSSAQARGYSDDFDRHCSVR